MCSPQSDAFSCYFGVEPRQRYKKNEKRRREKRKNEEKCMKSSLCCTNQGEGGQIRIYSYELRMINEGGGIRANSK